MIFFKSNRFKNFYFKIYTFNSLNINWNNSTIKFFNKLSRDCSCVCLLFEKIDFSIEDYIFQFSLINLTWVALKLDLTVWNCRIYHGLSTGVLNSSVPARMLIGAWRRYQIGKFDALEPQSALSNCSYRYHRAAAIKKKRLLKIVDFFNSIKVYFFRDKQF